MKFTIHIDCTAAEARQYMGLPDAAPMREAMLKQLQERTMSNVGSLAARRDDQSVAPDGNGKLVRNAKGDVGTDDVDRRTHGRQVLGSVSNKMISVRARRAAARAGRIAVLRVVSAG